MILDLPLPAGWARAPAVAPQIGGGGSAAAGAGDLEGDGGGSLIWPADAPSPVAATGPTSLSSIDNLSLRPALLIVSPLLPLPQSLPWLIEQGLGTEPDYVVTRRSALATPRLGPWEVVVLLTFGHSRETGIETGRIYAALDAGYGAFLLVFADSDPGRLPARQQQLYGMLADARLRQPDAAPDAAPDALAAAEIPPQRPPPELFLKDVLYRHLID